jgi:hypothetical protein
LELPLALQHFLQTSLNYPSMALHHERNLLRHPPVLQRWQLSFLNYRQALPHCPWVLLH